MAKKSQSISFELHQTSLFLPLDDRPEGEIDSLPGTELPSNFYPVFNSKVERDLYISYTMELFQFKHITTVKKEYIRTNILRSYKKNMRMFYFPKLVLKHKIKIIKKLPIEAQVCWKVFYEYLLINKSELKEISTTNSGPKTDGKLKKI